MNVPSKLILRLTCLIYLSAHTVYSQVDPNQLFYHYQYENQNELEHSLTQYLDNKKLSLHAQLTLGLIQVIGAEVQIQKYYKNNKPGYYLELDWELFQDYRDDFYQQFGISAGHYLLKYFFVGLKLQSKRNYPVPFYGLEVGARYQFKNKLNRFSLGLKGTATKPFPMKDVEGLGLTTFPEFQVTIGFRLSGYRNSSGRSKKNEDPTILPSPNFF